MGSESYTRDRVAILQGTNRFYEGDKRTRSWSSTPGFHTKERRDLPENPYTDNRTTAQQSPDTATYHNYFNGQKISSVSVGYQDGNSVRSQLTSAAVLALNQLQSADSLHNQALLQALVKAADAKTNLPVLFAEMSKTSALIMGTATRLYESYRAFRRLDLKTVNRLLNVSPTRVHKTWLEYKYGWMPLLMDVKNSAEFIAQQVVGRPLRFTVVGTAKSRVEGPYWNLSDAPGKLKSVSERVCRVKITCEVDSALLSGLQQLGLTNPALVAWELTPFSFVFDWFISVGQYLQGISALHGLSVVKAMKSTLETSAVSGAIVDPAFASASLGYRYSGATVPIIGGLRSYVRSPLVVSAASLYPPVNRDWFNWDRYYTGLALMRSSIRL